MTHVPDEKDHAMHGYTADIESLTEKNTAFRQVLYTGLHLQLVFCSIKTYPPAAS